MTTNTTTLPTRACDRRPIDRAALDGLVIRTWEFFARVRGADPTQVVTPSMPVLFFGDLGAYDRSDVRILTVGLNPSLREFPQGSPWSRFPGCADLAFVTGPDERQRSHYLSALSDYFKNDPYRNWFGSFEHVLTGLGASYYPRRGLATALHTDLASPVATDPSWSGLPRDQQALHLGGASLWHDLVGVLAPDVVIVSVARSHLSTITPLPLEEWDVVAEVPQHRRPYIVRATTASLGTRQGLVVFGPCVNVPFGSVALVERERIGERIAETLRKPSTSWR